MTKAKAILIILFASLAMMLVVGCDGDLDDVEDFLNDSDASKAVNETVENAAEAVEDYVTEMATDAADMTQKLTEGNIPEVSEETSQDLRELVIENLDTVGQAVLDVDTVAKELQACFEKCDAAFPDNGTNKTANNLTCVVECKGN